jgi:phage terminase large subunit-like protein
MNISEARRARLPSTRKEALFLYRSLLTEAAPKGAEAVRQIKRWLARNDLFFMLTVICKRKDISHDWLFDRCREVERNPNGFLDLWAREHYKSTVITFGLSLQDILASHGDDPEARYAGREVTIGILSFNRPSAKGFLRQIKRELEANEELKALFPEVLYDNPAQQAPKWSEDEGLTVKRKTNPKEATVEASGLVDGQPTGKHYFIRVYDDVVTRESVSTPEMIKKVTEAWELSTNLGTEGGWERYIGTRYHVFDSYSTMIERGIPPRVYPCTSDGSEDFSKAVLRSASFLEERRRQQGPYTFGAQMLLNPTADKAQGFREEWLRYWHAAHAANLNVYLLVDPASKKKKGNDYTSMWVFGVGGDRNFMILDAVRDRLNLVERQRTLFALHRKWRPLNVGYEEYGLQADIEHMKYVMGQENYRFTITPLGGRMAKEDRIRRLIPLFEAGRIWLPEAGIVRTDHEGKAVNIVRTFIEQEYTAFPVSAHDDMLDCLARLLDEEFQLSYPLLPEEQTPKWMRDLQDESSGRGWETA